MKKGDWFLFFGFLLIIAAMAMFGFYYYGQNVGECISDPIGYFVNDINSSFNGEADSVFGEITFMIGGSKEIWYIGDSIPLNNPNKLLNISS